MDMILSFYFETALYLVSTLRGKTQCDESPYLSLANCYFAHDSSGFPVPLRFCDAQSVRSLRIQVRPTDEGPRLAAHLDCEPGAMDGGTHCEELAARGERGCLALLIA